MYSTSDNIIIKSLIGIFRVWKREFRVVFRDSGVLIFFVLLPLTYPILYTLIYNTEQAKDVPVVIVDDARTPLTREFAQELDATQNIRVYDYAANLQDAYKYLERKDCYGVIYFPSDFSQKVGRGEPSPVIMYSEMSLLLRYKGLLVSLTDVAQNMGAKVQTANAASLGINAASYTAAVDAPVKITAVPMGNTAMGIATSLLPGIFMMVIQQSIILGIAMLAGGGNERRLKNYGYDPMAIHTGVINTMLGKALCYMTIYIVPTIFVLHYCPMIFAFPQNSIPINTAAMVLPYLMACIFFGMTIQVFVRERESSFIVILVSSVIFVFLAGFSWPRFAMNQFWYLIGDLVPATWGIDAFIHMKTNGANLEQVSHPYLMIWVVALVYFVIAFFIIKYVQMPRYKRMTREHLFQKEQEAASAPQ
ncbi:MAG: ABC transporter permease [Muribaculaceae bacterium]|jgi:ABC-2 type transport system permease protein|nr:ABC transporter permease [Muribaculaceae bacterium]